MSDEITTKPYQDTEYEGKPARLYPNGVIRSPKGYILFAPSNVAREMALQRTYVSQERAQEGIMLATQSSSPEEAVMKIIRRRTEVAMMDKGRAGNDAAKLVLEQAGFRVPETKQTEKFTVSINKHQYEIDKDTAELFDKLTKMKRDADIIDVEEE